MCVFVRVSECVCVSVCLCLFVCIRSDQKLRKKPISQEEI